MTSRKKRRTRRSGIGRPKARARCGRECGNALCGYVLKAPSNDKGETVLVNMKPKNNTQWTGNVYSRSGKTYYGTMTIKATTRCASKPARSASFCSGNNWTRIGGRADNIVTSRQRGRAAFVSAQGKVFMKKPGGVTTGQKGPSGAVKS